MRKRFPERIPQVRLANSYTTVNGPAFVYTNDDIGMQQIAYCEKPGGPHVVEYRAASLLIAQAFTSYEALRDAANAHIAELEEIDDAEGLESHVDDEAMLAAEQLMNDPRVSAALDAGELLRDVADPVLDAIVTRGADGHVGRAQREPHVSHAWRWTDEGAMRCPCGAEFEDFGDQGHATVGEPFEPCRGTPA